MKSFNRIAFVKRLAGAVGAAALTAAISLPALAQTEQPFEAPPGASETPSGSPSVPGTSPVDDPAMEGGSTRQPRSFSNEMDSSRIIRSGNQVRSLPFRTVPGPSESPSGSPAVIGSNSSSDPSQALSRTVAERVEQAQRRLEARNNTPRSGALGSEPGPSETPSGSPSVPGANRPSDPGLTVQ